MLGLLCRVLLYRSHMPVNPPGVHHSTPLMCHSHRHHSHQFSALSNALHVPASFCGTTHFVLILSLLQPFLPRAQASVIRAWREDHLVSLLLSPGPRFVQLYPLLLKMSSFLGGPGHDSPNTPEDGWVQGEQSLGSGWDLVTLPANGHAWENKTSPISSERLTDTALEKQRDAGTASWLFWIRSSDWWRKSGIFKQRNRTGRPPVSSQLCC